MPGHMGCRRATIQGLRVLDVNPANNMLLIQGAVPGHPNAILAINRSQKKKFRSLDQKRAVVIHKVNPMKQSKAKAKGKA